MRKEIRPADIANGIYVFLRGSQAPVYMNTLLAKFYAGFFQPQPVDYGTSSRCNQDPFTFDGAPIGQCNLPGITLASYTGDLGCCDDSYSLGFQGFLEQYGCLAVPLCQQPVSGFDNRHLAAKTRKSLCQFHANGTATDHGQMTG